METAMRHMYTSKISIFCVRTNTTDSIILTYIRNSFITFLLMIVVLIPTACSSISIEDYEKEKPSLILENYLNGDFDAYGMFINRSGKVTRRMTVVMKAVWKGDECDLFEDFIWSDGVKQKRIWHLKKIAPNKYEGRADDVVGVAYGEVSGNAFHWYYTLSIDVDGTFRHINFDDWMYLINDKIMLNKAVMTKFGIKVGEVNITFIKRK
jgi:hypothetical protein